MILDFQLWPRSVCCAFVKKAPQSFFKAPDDIIFVVLKQLWTFYCSVLGCWPDSTILFWLLNWKLQNLLPLRKPVVEWGWRDCNCWVTQIKLGYPDLICIHMFFLIEENCPNGTKFSLFVIGQISRNILSENTNLLY